MFTAFPDKLLQTPAVYPVPEHDIDNVQALFIESVPYEGKETRVFAYYGLPESKTPCPAVLLLHGGGGTAFPEWVRIWNRRGYAAVALDLEGHRPLAAEPAHVELTSHPHSGPARRGEFADIDRPVTDQWMYHAVAAAMVAVSFLRAQPEVNPDLVGVNGISWGGMVTANLLCADPRLAFAIPVYGCGALGDGATYFGPVFQRQEVATLWDCTEALPRVTTPTLWLNGARDMHFPPDATSRCHLATPGSHMLLLPDLDHGYDGAGWEVPEVYAFADAVCGIGEPLLHLPPSLDGGLPAGAADATLWLAADGLCYPEPERRCETRWEAHPYDPVKPPLPDSGAAFINVTDALGRRVSTPLLTGGTR